MLTLFILESLLLVFLTVAFFHALTIVRRFNPAETTPLQYALEKKSYLVAVIIRFALLVKLAVFVYFVYGLDKLSNVITGAMCAAGVVTATEYGVYLMGLKLLNLFLFGFWLVINRLDIERETYPFTKIKFAYFLPLFSLIAGEYLLFLLHIGSLNPAAIVSCCGVLFSSANTSVMGSLVAVPDVLLLTLFYAIFFLISLFSFMRNMTGVMVSSLLFLPVSLLAIITFFSTYIYELPTHRCPFCILQKEYAYIGYLIYLLLFWGSFMVLSESISRRFLKTGPGYLGGGLILLALFVLLVSYYPLAYYLKNGVFL